MGQKTTRVVLKTADNIDPNQLTEGMQLYNSAGVAVAVVTKQAAQADTVAADLAALKVDFNLLLAKLRLANVIG